MAYDEGLAQRVREAFAGRDVLFDEKRMMGGLCFMVNDKMCVGVEKDRLMVRLDPAIETKALRRKGCVPMDFTGRPMRGFVFIQPEGCADDSDLNHWLNLALAFNPKANASRQRRSK